ncbi:MAG: hypothetical protein ACUVXA_19540 [Candidatus Jordarchaeum sp.]
MRVAKKYLGDSLAKRNRTKLHSEIIAAICVSFGLSPVGFVKESIESENV